jgi:peptide/nickel transport system permease protein
MAFAEQSIEARLLRQRSGPFAILTSGWHFIRRYPLIPLFVLTVLALSGILAPVIAPSDTATGSLRDRQLPPFSRGYVSPSNAAEGEVGAFHLLGTDHAGRDILSRIMYGARISLMVAAIALISGFVIGTFIGVVSGYLGGIWDEIITRLVDIWYAIPFLMVALVVTLLFGQSLQLLLGLLAALAWAGFVRVIRAQTLILKEMDYVDLARVAGASPFRIMFRHIMPGVVSSAVVIATFNVGGLILAEATLSFLGAGIPPPTPAWGVMVGEGKDYLATAWWESIMPGTAIFLTLMSLNFLGDWLRDRLDPRLRQVD